MPITKFAFLSILVAFCATLTWASKFKETGTRFYVSTSQRSFVGALIDCKTGGMELATVQSQEEQEQLNIAIQSIDYQSIDGYWIGGAADQYSTSDSWYWLSTGLRLIYTNWGVGQPRYVYKEESQNCIRLGNFDKANEPYFWENVNCNLQLNYVCKSST